MREQKANPNREKREQLAGEHTQKMETYYSNEIKDSIKSTKSYDQKVAKAAKHPAADMKVELVDLDSVAAACKYREGKTAILNFASYRNPGGGFLRGSKAQEECLCHASFLYNVLSKFPEFYNKNIENTNKLLYTDRALYSENILFQCNQEDFYCDVITCAAPNKAAAQRNYHVTEEENAKALRSRIKFVIDIAEDNKVDSLILGAFGCGVFGQNAKEVAGTFQEFLTGRSFYQVIFAVPSGKDGNLQAFRKALKL